MRLTEAKDRIIWNLGSKGFTVRSLYQKLKTQEIPFPKKFLWKVKIPQRIKVFIWLMLKNSILTKDNLKARCYNGDTSCTFCAAQESIQHVMFDC